jgi:hypothetical protein
LLRKEKNFNIVLVKTILQNDGKIFCQFQWENNEIILRRIMWENERHAQYFKLEAQNRKDITPKEL